MKGYFYNTKTTNYYYDIDDKELYSFGRYENGVEDDICFSHFRGIEMDFDAFYRHCLKLESNQ